MEKHVSNSLEKSLKAAFLIPTLFSIFLRIGGRRIQIFTFIFAYDFF